MYIERADGAIEECDLDALDAKLLYPGDSVHATREEMNAAIRSGKWKKAKSIKAKKEKKEPPNGN